MTSSISYLLTILAICTVVGCTKTDSKISTGNDTPSTSMPAQAASHTSKAVHMKYRIKKVLPHSTDAFTQGLEIHDGIFIESTGTYEASSLRRVGIDNGKVLKNVPMSKNFFGEGSTVLNNEIYTLTWQNRTGFVSDAKTLQQKRTFSYSDEGWGICNDGVQLYRSNGSNLINVCDPASFQSIRTITVTLDGVGLDRLNELEWIDGEIWANVWQEEFIVAIDPATGNVTKVLDLDGILPVSERTPTTDVLNGITWDSSSKTMYVTGKNWPHVYALEVTP